MKNVYKALGLLAALTLPVVMFAAAPDINAHVFEAAVDAGNHDAVAACLDHPAFVGHAVTAAEQAIQKNKMACLAALFAHGKIRPLIFSADFDKSVGYTVLHCAADKGSLAAVRFIISHDSVIKKINTADSKGRTPLAYAASRKSDHYENNGSKIVEKLLAKGAHDSLVITDSDGNCPLHLAEDPTTIDLLLQAYAAHVYKKRTMTGTYADFLDIRNAAGQTAFGLAIQNAQWEKVAKILEHAYENKRTISVTREESAKIGVYIALHPRSSLCAFMNDSAKVKAVAKTDLSIVLDAARARVLSAFGMVYSAAGSLILSAAAPTASTEPSIVEDVVAPAPATEQAGDKRRREDSAEPEVALPVAEADEAAAAAPAKKPRQAAGKQARALRQLAP